VDDNLTVAEADKIVLVAAIIFIFLRMCRAPLSWGKSFVGVSSDWAGFFFCLKSLRVGMTHKKWKKIVEPLREMLNMYHWPLEKLHTCVSRLQWWSYIVPWFRPFLRTCHLEIARIDRGLMQHAKRMKWLSETGAVLPECMSRFKKMRKSKWVDVRKFKQDLAVWIYCLNRADIVQRFITAPESAGVAFRTDACASRRHGGLGGYGVPLGLSCEHEPNIDCSNVTWYQWLFKSNDSIVESGPVPSKRICYLEGLGSLAAFKDFFLKSDWVKVATKQKVVVECDNAGVVSALTSWRSGFALHKVVREYAWGILQRRLWGFEIRHLAGERNCWADDVSRDRVVDKLLPNKQFSPSAPNMASNKVSFFPVNFFGIEDNVRLYCLRVVMCDDE